eukprot:scaffold1965_cov192-Pinguiococcus_pyrenoidosus.AAC.1
MAKTCRSEDVLDTVLPSLFGCRLPCGPSLKSAKDAPLAAFTQPCPLPFVGAADLNTEPIRMELNNGFVAPVFAERSWSLPGDQWTVRSWRDIKAGSLIGLYGCHSNVSLKGRAKAPPMDPLVQVVLGASTGRRGNIKRHSVQLPSCTIENRAHAVRLVHADFPVGGSMGCINHACGEVPNATTFCVVFDGDDDGAGVAQISQCDEELSFDSKASATQYYSDHVRVLVVATRDIECGEEITMPYVVESHGLPENKPWFICNCQLCTMLIAYACSAFGCPSGLVGPRLELHTVFSWSKLCAALKLELVEGNFLLRCFAVFVRLSTL